MPWPRHRPPLTRCSAARTATRAADDAESCITAAGAEAVEGEFAGAAVAADEQPAVSCVFVVVGG
jgi:hypothetical protein